MIIACPQCLRSFEVSDSIFQGRPEGRKVRCGGCKSEWVAVPEVIAPPPLIEPVMATPQTIECPMPARDPFEQDKPLRFRVTKSYHRGGALTWVLFMITITIMALFFAIVMRHHMVVKWPGLAAYYRAIGIPVVVAPPSFTLNKLTWGVRKDKNKHYLRVQGEVGYKSERELSQRVPLLRVIGYGPNACAPQDWRSKLTQGTDIFLERGLCIGEEWMFRVTDESAIPGEVFPFTTEKEFDVKAFDPKAVSVEFMDS